MGKYYFTSESVSCGHPDKICDQISDAILDEFLRQDTNSKVACEAFITNNLLVIGGEAHSNASVDIVGTAKKVLEEIGYDGTNGFNPETAIFVNTLHEQSSDIRQGVDREDAEMQGAGDQGIMFGYACKETSDFMPLPIVLSNQIMFWYDFLRKTDMQIRNAMGPDAKCQCTVVYEDDKPIMVDTIVLSMQHKANTPENFIRTVASIIMAKVFMDGPYKNYFKVSTEEGPKTKILVNPTGRFVIGGPEGDTGLTGRKIVVDTYGGKCPHGGGAFSGKDPSKVDRSAAYYARYIAKNLVYAGIADEITVQLSYGIGMAYPISVYVDGKLNSLMYSKEMVCQLIMDVFNPTPYNIISSLGLKDFTNYQDTATYGHFKTLDNADYPWERLDKFDNIVNWLNKNGLINNEQSNSIE